MDERPPVWIGHAVLAVKDVNRSVDFWRDLGLREIERREDIGVLELRGGTHLLLRPGEPVAGSEAPFDLMVDDLAATREEWAGRGLDPTPVEKGPNHSTFTVLDPNGYRVVVRSSHVVGPV